jgi:hypothetical protein
MTPYKNYCHRLPFGVVKGKSISKCSSNTPPPQSLFGDPENYPCSKISPNCESKTILNWNKSAWGKNAPHRRTVEVGKASCCSSQVSMESANHHIDRVSCRSQVACFHFVGSYCCVLQHLGGHTENR